jgi:hypothetical protein
MKKKTVKSASLAAALGTALFLSSCDLDGLLLHDGDLKLDEKVVMGLKTTLQVGIDSSSTVASKVNGYLANQAIRILLPEEAEQALATAEEVGELVKPFKAELSAMQSLVDLTFGADKNAFTSNLSASGTLLTQVTQLEGVGDSVIKYMNRAAEMAAPRSVPIFKGAITDMTINDGLSLLNSSDSTAATLYLNGKTFRGLSTAYTPLVDSTLDLVPLTRFWGDFRNGYNSVLANYQKLLAFQASWNGNAAVKVLPGLQINGLKPVANRPITTESLGQWTTEHALVGLFHLVGEEEKDIRRDPIGYVKGLAADASELLKEVFGDIMEMEK